MRTPKYRKHSTRNFAFVEVEGQRVRLRGDYDSAESWAHYHDVCAMIRRGGVGLVELLQPKPKKLSVIEMVTRYLASAELSHDGSSRGDFVNYKNASALFVSWGGTMDAATFGPKALKEFQAALITTRKAPPKGRAAEDMPTLSRTYINDVVSRVKSIFKWAVSEELIPPAIHQGLSTVRGLKKGKTAAREAPKRKAVPMRHVAAVLRHVPKVVRDMIRVQVLTGARSDSICNARPREFDTKGELWLWRPKHKTQHKGVELVLPIGPRCQRVLGPYLAIASENEFLFRPKMVRKDSRYRKKYDSQSYGTAIRRGVAKLNKKMKVANRIPSWSPHQLRHLKGTVVNDHYGIEAAQAILGHDSINATRVYRASRLELAKKIARETG